MQNWKYYNHAAIPKVTPHQVPDLSPIEDKSIWSIDGNRPLLARWTEDFDCGYETNWWYVIKDEPFDASLLKAKRRYEITKGEKNFEVRKITPADHKKTLYDIQVAAFSAYPEKYRPTVEKQAFFSSIDGWDNYDAYGVFLRESGEMVGYSLLSSPLDGYVDFAVLRTKPQYERLAVNAGFVAGILSFYKDFLANGGYISDGTRSINHETMFQDYLEKYFGFRKAYCRLRIRYNPKFGWLVKILYPFRKLFGLFDSINLIHQVHSILRMEEMTRETT